MYVTSLLVLPLLSKVLHHEAIHIAPSDHHKSESQLSQFFDAREKLPL